MIDSAVLGTLHIGLETLNEWQRPNRRRQPALNRARRLVFAVGRRFAASIRVVAGRPAPQRTPHRDPAQP